MKIATRHVLMMTMILSTGLFSGLLSGCGKDKSNDPQGSVYATVPQGGMSQQCLSTANPAAWSQYSNYGFAGYNGGYGSYGNYMPLNGMNQPGYGNPGYGAPGYGTPGYGNANYYPQGPTTPYAGNYPYQSNNAFCGCPMGYIPVCGGQNGMGCMLENRMPNNYAVYQYNQNQWSAGTFGNPGYAGMYQGNRCFQAVGQTCVVNSYDCGRAAVCMPTGSGSPIGVCVGY